MTNLVIVDTDVLIDASRGVNEAFFIEAVLWFDVDVGLGVSGCAAEAKT